MAQLVARRDGRARLNSRPAVLFFALCAPVKAAAAAAAAAATVVGQAFLLAHQYPLCIDHTWFYRIYRGFLAGVVEFERDCERKI